MTPCVEAMNSYVLNALDSCAGAARAVSRRYIADFVSKRERTKASAAFVGSSAMGMALGPLLARLFQSFPTLHFGPLTFNYITMGACAPHCPIAEHDQLRWNLCSIQPTDIWLGYVHGI